MSNSRDELTLYRTLRVAREAYRQAKARRHHMRVAVRLAEAEVLSTHADVVAAEAALREAEEKP